MKRYKIGLVLDDSLDRNDGVQQYVRTLGAWLEKNKHTVHYLVGETHSNRDNIHSLSRNVRVRFNKNRLTIPLPARSNKVKALLAKERYDILHVQMPYSPLMAGKVIREAPPLCGIVGTFHILPYGNLQRWGSTALRLVQSRQLKRYDSVCSVSPAAQEFARSHFGINSSVIPNMIDVANWENSARPMPYKIVFLGRLVQRKGAHVLLQALARLPMPLLSKLEVIIAGSGPDRQALEKLAQKLPVKNITFLGYIEENMKVDLLASAQLAVFPAIGGESFGIVLIEAMAAGSEVVLGGNNPGYASVLGEHSEALLITNNIVQLAAQIEMFITDAALRRRVHADQQKLLQKYDVNVVGEQIVSMYTSVVLHQTQNVRQ
jgi:phosphatidyl-myo-inositol alpha-mannosyltransferase